VLSSSSPLYEIPLLTFWHSSRLVLKIFHQNLIFFSQTHSAYLQTAVVCYEYDPVVAIETAQVVLDPHQAF